jgi:hypothetical protein
MSGMNEEECRRIIALFKMVEDGSKDGASEHIKNEAANATPVLLRLLSKHGLTLGDIPEIKLRHEQYQAVKDAAKAAGTTGAATAANPAAPQGGDPMLFDLLRHILEGYSDIEPHEYAAAILWALHTHVYGNFQITPRLAALSPVPGCGKSMTLKVLERFAANPERHSNISAASLFRLIESGEVSTYLLDEGDNAGLRQDRTLRTVLNEGHSPEGKITRTIRGEVRRFSIFAPVAIGAIGTLPLPLTQRSIIINMHKQRRDLKTLEDLASPEEAARLDGLRRLIVEWAQGVKQFDRAPPLPKILRGRLADNWRVMISVADSFGDARLSKIARDAAVTFANGYSDEAAPVALLYDTRTICRQEGGDRIKSATLVQKLNEMEDGVGIWNAWRGENNDQLPHAITQGETAALFRKFDRGLRPKPLFELGSTKAARGYFWKQFEPWWARYCPDDLGNEGEGAEILPLRAAASE